jgi:predicted RNA binding protein YcfA (HicA-like mRNA interferase family)
MPVSHRDLVRKLKRLGFRGPYSGGRHQFMARGALKVRIPNPHKSKDISDSLLNEVLRQAGISRAEFDSC